MSVFFVLQTKPLSNKVIYSLQQIVKDLIEQAHPVHTSTVPLALTRRLQGVRMLEHVVSALNTCPVNRSIFTNTCKVETLSLDKSWSCSCFSCTS